MFGKIAMIMMTAAALMGGVRKEGL